MSGAEERPEEEKPEGEEGGQQYENLVDLLAPAYRNHVEEFLAIMVHLGDIKYNGPAGTFLKIENWIFPVIEKCKEISGKGILVHAAEGNEVGWIRCYGAGMPRDMPPLNIYYIADTYHEKYKDFAIHGQGVIGDPDNPEKGKSAWRWIFTHPITHKEYSFHLWVQTVYLRNSTTQMIGHYNSGVDAVYTQLLQMERNIRVELTDILLSDTASAHLLLNNTVLLTDSQRILDAAANRQGGDWRKQAIQEMWADENVLKGFARLVKELRPLWGLIKLNVDWKGPLSSEQQENWVSDMWERDEIKPFAAKYPKFTKKLLARAVDNELPNLDREPRQLAFFHASLEVQVNINGEMLSIVDAYLKYQEKPLAPISLKPYFDKGKALLDPSE